MKNPSNITLILGIATALVALIGYWSNQFIKRRETKSQVYAEALQAIHRYEELPYVIRRRPGASNEIRAELSEKISEVFVRISYYQTLLGMESLVVSEAYTELFKQTRKTGGPYRKEAWGSPIIASDEEISGVIFYPYDNNPELEICLLAMRRELTPWGWIMRRVTRRKIRRLRQDRPSWNEPDWMRQRRIVSSSEERDRGA
ncbi:hypothetical protein [Actinocorallia aurantiaca]|uniref:Uncharacterized protein n=1 Tax=Actinocorallia aurantiaca TaxID=46204 RepID=A0ABN3TZT0_9ACTN